MFGLKEKAANTAKRAGLISLGSVLCCVGVGFLTLAAWLALEPEVGALTAAIILACVYLGLGIIFIAFGANGPADRHPQQPLHAAQPEPTRTPSNAPPLMQAFLYGMDAGARADKRRR